MKHKYKIFGVVLCMCGCIVSVLVWYNHHTYGNSTITIFSENLIKELCDFSTINYQLDDITVTDEDIAYAKDNAILDVSQPVDIEDRSSPLQGDIVYYNLLIFDNHTNAIKQIQENRHMIMGESYNNKIVEEQLYNATIGIEFTFIYGDNSALSERVIGKITAIKHYPELSINSQFVKEHYDCDSIEEFNSYIHDLVYAEKKNNRDMYSYKNILDLLCQNSTFTINKRELNSIYNQLVSRHEQVAGMYDISLDEYISEVLNISKLEFYKLCYLDSIKSIQYHLIQDYILKNHINTYIDEIELIEYYNWRNISQLQLLRNPDLRESSINEIISQRMVVFVLDQFAK